MGVAAAVASCTSSTVLLLWASRESPGGTCLRVTAVCITDVLVHAPGVSRAVQASASARCRQRPEAQGAGGLTRAAGLRLSGPPSSPCRRFVTSVTGALRIW